MYGSYQTDFYFNYFQKKKKMHCNENNCIAVKILLKCFPQVFKAFLFYLQITIYFFQSCSI